MDVTSIPDAVPDDSAGQEDTDLPAGVRSPTTSSETSASSLTIEHHGETPDGGIGHATEEKKSMEDHYDDMYAEDNGVERDGDTDTSTPGSSIKRFNKPPQEILNHLMSINIDNQISIIH